MTNLSQHVDLSLVRQMMEVSGAGLLVAISGGVDSVVLLDLLLAAGIKPALAHVNYALRGDDSDADAELVQQLARKHELAFHYRKIMPDDWPAHQSIEMGARNLRYRWFARLCRDFNYQAVLTAHHLDDSLETVLLNLVRGTGLAGLGGMAPITTLRFEDQELCVLRPLLGVNKQLILDYAAGQNLIWREDLSNQTDQYQRNVMRHQVLPALQQSFPIYEKTLPRSLARIGEELKLLAQLKRRFRRAIDQRNEAMLVGEVVFGYGPKISPRAYLRHLTLLQPILASMGMTIQNQQQALGLLQQDISMALQLGYCYRQGNLVPIRSGKMIDQDTLITPQPSVPFSKAQWMTPSHQVILDRHRLFVVPRSSYEALQSPDYHQLVPLQDGLMALPSPILGQVDRLTVSDHATLEGNLLVLDPTMVGPETILLLRPTKAGDKIKQKGMPKGSKRVVEILSAAGLPDHHKQATWVIVTVDGQVVGIVGRMLSAAFAAKEGKAELNATLTAIRWQR